LQTCEHRRVQATTNEALLGWLKGINAVELSPDGQRFAVAGNAKVAALYDASSQLVAELEHFGTVGSIAFRPDGEMLATGSWDMGARLWTRDGELIALLEGHYHRVSGLAWSADGSLLATGSRDGSVRVWAVGADEPIERWSATGLESKPHVVTWLGDDLVVGAERAVEVRDRDGVERARAATGFVRRLRVSDDGVYVAAEHHVWELQNRIDSVTVWDAQLRELWTGPAAACAFGRGGVIAVANGGVLTLRSLPGGEERWSLPCHDAGISCVAARDDGGWVTGGLDAIACAISTDGAVAGIIRHDNGVQFCSVGGGVVLTTTNTGATALWSDSDLAPAPAARPDRAPVVRLELGGQCNSAAFSPEGERFAISTEARVEIRRAGDGGVVHRFDCDESTWAVAWNGSLVSARLHDSASRRVWSADAGQRVVDLPDAFDFELDRGIAVVGDEPLSVYRAGDAPPAFELLATYEEADKYATVVSPTGRFVFVAADGGGLLLDTVSGESTSMAIDGPRKAAFSPDETRLVTCTTNTVVLWHLDRLDEPRALDVAPVWQLAWSPAGDRLAIGTAVEQTVLLRGDGAHVATLGERLRGADNPVFSSDGKTLATGGRGGPAALWRAADAEPIAELGGLATNHIKVVPVAGDTRWLTHANVSPAGDLTLRLWGREGEPVASMPGHDGKSWWQVNVSPCSNWIVSIVWGDRPRVWDARTGELWGTLDGHGPNVRVGVFAPPGSDGHVRLVTAGDDGVFALWDVGD
jgi:WD40 repeat protein